jgi:uncharacterized protein YbjT (DUF2867 family)
VFIVTGHNPDIVEQQNNVIDAARDVGTEYLVRVSGARAVAKADSESVVGRGHAAINERLKASGIKWVILSPSMFMQNSWAKRPRSRQMARWYCPSPGTCRWR